MHVRSREAVRRPRRPSPRAGRDQNRSRVGMTIGIAPITGITLPFISFGGSSMITMLAMVGLLQAIQARGRLAGQR